MYIENPNGMHVGEQGTEVTVRMTAIVTPPTRTEQIMEKVIKKQGQLVKPVLHTHTSWRLEMPSISHIM